MLLNNLVMNFDHIFKHCIHNFYEHKVILDQNSNYRESTVHAYKTLRINKTAKFYSPLRDSPNLLTKEVDY